MAVAYSLFAGTDERRESTKGKRWAAQHHRSSYWRAADFPIVGAWREDAMRVRVRFVLQRADLQLSRRQHFALSAARLEADETRATG